VIVSPSIGSLTHLCCPLSEIVFCVASLGNQQYRPKDVAGVVVKALAKSEQSLEGDAGTKPCIAPEAPWEKYLAKLKEIVHPRVKT
jgi:hypothetical protein